MELFRSKYVPDCGHPAVRFIFSEMNRQRASLGQVERRSGVTGEAIRKWRRQRSPNLVLVEAVLNALGYELVIRKMHDGDDE